VDLSNLYAMMKVVHKLQQWMMELTMLTDLLDGPVTFLVCDAFSVSDLSVTASGESVYRKSNTHLKYRLPTTSLGPQLLKCGCAPASSPPRASHALATRCHDNHRHQGPPSSLLPQSIILSPPRPHSHPNSMQ